MPLEWEPPVVYELTSPQGTLPFNEELTTSGKVIFLDAAKCVARPTLRAEVDDVPQGDGGIHHAQFKSGFTIQLAVEFWLNSEEAACGSDVTDMWDELHVHLDALVNPSQADLEAGLCRLEWTPAGKPARIYDRLKLAEWPTPELDAGVWTATFALHTPYPYSMSLAQTTTDVDLVSGTVVNLGNTPFFPVFRVHGPAANFVITNASIGEQFTYLDSLPGAVAIAGGDYVEIVTFDGTVYLNGNVADRKAGIAVDQSSFFPLRRGENVISAAGDYGSVEMLWNHAWVS